MYKVKGFTLIEIVAGLSMISLVSGVGAVQYSYFKTKSANSSAVADLQAVMLAQEAYFETEEEYAGNINDLAGLDSETLSVTAILSQKENTWAASSYHPEGTKTFCFHSNLDELIILQGLNQTCPS